MTKHNTFHLLTLPTLTISTSSSACVLGTTLHKKLSWEPQLPHMELKLVIQTNALTSLTASTRDTSLWVSRLHYIAIVCPVITTGCPAEWAPLICHFLKESLGGSVYCWKLMSQNCLYSLLGYTSTKPLYRSQHYPSASTQEQQAGQISTEVCRVGYRYSDWRGYSKGQTLSQLHQDLPLTI
jgi:hypothetical protein